MKRPSPAIVNLPNPDDFAKRDVLVEYDGPRLVLFSSRNGALRLGSLLEMNKRGSRWLVANVSTIEAEAIARAMLPMREAFEKESLAVLHLTSSGDPQAISEAMDSERSEDALPSPGALLPSDSRALLLKKVALKDSPVTRRVRFDGRRLVESRIEFAHLSRVTGSLQKVWTAFARTLGIDVVTSHGGPSPAALVADARLVPGSVALALHPVNPDAFDMILSRYQQTVGAVYGDSAKVLEAIDSEDVQKQLREYISVLADLEVDTMFEAPTRRVFIGHSRARVIRATFKGAGRGPAKEPAPTPETLVKQGRFDLVGLAQRTFAFVDIDTGDIVEGPLDKALADRLRRDGVTVGGEDTLYRATFSVSGTTTTLVSFEPLQIDLFHIA